MLQLRYFISITELNTEPVSLRNTSHYRETRIDFSFTLYYKGEKKASSEAVSEYLQSRKKYEEMRTQKLKKGSSREAQVRSRKCLTSS